MYYLCGFEENLRNIFAISCAQEGAIRPKNIEQLKTQYITFLQKYHPHLPIEERSDVIIEDEATEDALCGIFKTDSILNDRAQTQLIGSSFAAEEKAIRRKAAEAALHLLERLEPKLGSLLRLAIHSIFFRDSAGAAAGSASTGVGVIWLNTKEHLSTWDVLELCVHELTHNLAFVDELRYGHYNYNLVAKKENFAISSILKTRRPLDKVVHSILVSTEIYLLRQAFPEESIIAQVHPPTGHLKLSTLKAIQSVYSLTEIDAMVRPRVHELLSRCSKVLTTTNEVSDSAKLDGVAKLAM
jgi:hypothetical protein